jgi:hypothetical protein
MLRAGAGAAPEIQKRFISPQSQCLYVLLVDKSKQMIVAKLIDDFIPDGGFFPIRFHDQTAFF